MEIFKVRLTNLNSIHDVRVIMIILLDWLKCMTKNVLWDALSRSRLPWVSFSPILAHIRETSRRPTYVTAFKTLV